MPSVVAASTQLPPEDNWEPREKDLKTYLHFDRNISREEISAIANDKMAVAQHAFFPLIRFHETWTKFRKDGKRTKKVRPLRYAARIDAAIYARYRSVLSKAYEKELARRELSDVPVAYRKLPKKDGGNKSNIEISRDVFAFIKRTEDCVVTVVDIKSYFESLCHKRIRETWEMLLGSPMPSDHLAIYRNLTRYSVVDYDKVLSRLKLYEKPAIGPRITRRRRGVDELRSNHHKQLCSPADFRKLVAGADSNYPSLIQKNGFDFGIPQGTPISDLVANFYLIDFDEEMQKWAAEGGGLYRRYFDDIIVVMPISISRTDLETKNFLQQRIQAYGDKLRIQDRKVSVVRFEKDTVGLKFSHIFGSSSRNGLEYLGFEYDGKRVKIRNSTLSNAWRKMKRQAYGHAAKFVKRYRAKGLSWIVANYPAPQLETHILRDVTYTQDEGYKSWTFIKYVRRSSRSFIGFNPIFSMQTKRYRYYTKLMIGQALQKALDVHLK